MKDDFILGISAFYHDSAAAILKNGRIIAAAQEERFTRVKGDSSFPLHAISFCLERCGISPQAATVVFYENSVEKFERILTTAHMSAPKSITMFLNAMPKWLTDNLWMESKIKKELSLKKNRVRCCGHHLSHAASAFYPSPFDEAAILTIDGVGEWTTAAFGKGSGNKIELLKEMRFPNSVGLLYSAFTFYTGFKINSGEYKLMGLAPYGEPVYTDLIRDKLIHINADGSVILNQKYFSYTYNMETVNKEFEKLFGRAARKPESPMTKFDADIAASIQAVTNEIVLKMARSLRRETGCVNLTMAGGVALNVVAAGNLLRNSGFERVWIQPASGDAGGALGAAFYEWHHVLGNDRNPEESDSMAGSFLGLEIQKDNKKDDAALKELGGVWARLPDSELAARVANLIAGGAVVGIARGRAEWGPRALGNRSILASATDKEMQTRLNQKIKFRESFRPFAPIVLEEYKSDYFDMDVPSPYMLMTFPIAMSRRLPFEIDENDFIKTVSRPRSDIPAVTHLDYSARVQTVDKERNPFLYSVLSEYKKATGCPVAVNTSFNIRGEPIVNTAEDAYRCFMSTDMDYTVIGNRLFEKKTQKRKRFQRIKNVGEGVAVLD